MNNLENSQQETECIESLSGKVSPSEAVSEDTNQPAISRCQEFKPDGAPCRARTLLGKSFCFFHDPAATEKRKAASSRGGAKKSCPVPDRAAIDIPLSNRDDVAALLTKTINQLRQGAIDPKIANGIGFLVGIWLRVTETNALEDRLAALETVVRRNPPPVW